MTEIHIIIAVVTWWTFAVATFSIGMSQSYDSFSWRVMAYCIAWPLLIPIMAVAVPYDVLIKSTKRIRTDLRNRKLLREFEAWLKERDQ